MVESSTGRPGAMQAGDGSVAPSWCVCATVAQATWSSGDKRCGVWAKNRADLWACIALFTLARSLLKVICIPFFFAYGESSCQNVIRLPLPSSVSVW
jgi:hypothetical protein